MLLVHRGLTAAGTALVAAASVTQAQTASISVSNASPAGDLGDAGNTALTGSFGASFTAQSLHWSGTLTSAPNPFFFEEDVFAAIEGPNGLGYTGPIAGQQGIFLGSTPFSGWFGGLAPASINGNWRFEAFTPNSFANATDWSIQNAEFTFAESLFPDAAPAAVGDDLSFAITDGEIAWFSIDHAGGPIELSTAGSSLFELEGAIQTDDTLIALFDSNGALVEFNDDASAGVSTSRLFFNDLASGDYRLAVTGATLGTRVGPSFIATSHDAEGDVRLSVAIPAPATATALAGALGLLRRRRIAL